MVLLPSAPDIHSVDLVHVVAAWLRMLERNCVVGRSGEPGRAVESHRLRRLVDPASIAVVGVSPKGGYGLGTVENLERFGFPGRIYQVNPNYREVAGRPAWPDLASLPEAVDAVAIAVPARATPGVVRDAIATGAGGAVAFAAGFAELGAEGLSLQAEIAALGRESGFPLIGPNCLGVVNYVRRTPLWGITTGTRTEAGRIAVVGQSGNIVLSLMSSTCCPPVSHAVSCGNQAVVDAVEVIDFFLGDPEVRVVIAVMETIGDVAAFRRVAARAAERETPIIVLKLGRSMQGSRAAVAHTGSLTGATHLADALFDECGVIRGNDLDEAEAVAALLAAKRRPAGRGLGVTASSGGECGLVSDIAAAAGLTLPELPASASERIAPLLPPFARPANPLDITAVGWGYRDVSRETIAALAAIPGVDIVASVGQASAYVGSLDEYGWWPMVEGLGDVAANGSTPIVVVSTVPDVQPELVAALAAYDIPVLAGTQTAIHAIASAGRSAEWLRDRPAPAVAAPIDERRRAKALALLPPAGSGGVSETMSKAVADLYGIPTPAGGIATTVDEALGIARETGYPVVLKIEADGLHHKTEAGGVVVGLDSDDAVRVAYPALVRRVMTAVPDAGIRGVRVERMAPEGVELVVGGTNDPALGPAVVVGMGGVLVELLRDAVHGLAPVDMAGGLRMLAALRGRPLLEGFRGGRPADTEAVAAAIAAVSTLLSELPEVREIDINPLVALGRGDGCVALDCLLVV